MFNYFEVFAFVYRYCLIHVTLKNVKKMKPKNAGGRKQENNPIFSSVDWNKVVSDQTVEE